MAIVSYTLEVLKQLLSHIPHRPVEMLSLAYPDIIVPASKIRATFGDEVANALRFRNDSNEVL